ncbi:flagellar biosynthetic protein FliQ [Carnobacterium iners]|uniref:Flagellar biosynthetic protein FliQ n=1 Tax=Carnobacterium iners TaxID=1073423 RepID=A0A1X7N0V5_9LACT|nr:flagellar biosynthesis protein FliQ [Carnobacterium iners]SEK22268.1 flagellar biosynthetic protein FliQ [Carnobacterium iners]SMH30864.1 flagellar biosynthetic protein FliQ [Carnobacterium iners]
MTIVKVLDIIREAFTTMIVVAGPVLIIALVVGLLISILQATTQLQEQTLSFVPKILAVVVSLIVFGNFMLNALIGFTQKIFEMIAML